MGTKPESIPVHHSVDNAPVVVLPCGTAQFVRWARRVFDRCQWCDQPFVNHHKKKGASRDHLHPRSKGGQNVVENLVLSCRECNERRSSKPVSNKLPFYGPRWKCMTKLVQEGKQVDGLCTLWVQRDGEKWTIIFEGTYLKCFNRKKKAKKENIGTKTHYMITPKGVMVAKKLREDRLVDIIRRTVEERERFTRIAVRAYHKWQQQGYSHGNDVQHWLEAEQEEWDTDY